MFRSNGDGTNENNVSSQLRPSNQRHDLRGRKAKSMQMQAATMVLFLTISVETDDKLLPDIN